MTVTELALLRLTGHGTLTEDIKIELRKAKQAMEAHTGRTFYFLQQIEDPACIYVLGEWESLEDHYEGFIPSQANKQCLERLEGKIEVVRLVHSDVRLLPVPHSPRIVLT